MAVASQPQAAGVVPNPFLRRFTYEALIELVFGLPAQDPRMARMLELYPRVESATLAKVDGREVRAALAVVTKEDVLGQAGEGRLAAKS